MITKFSQDWIESIFKMQGKCNKEKIKELMNKQGFKKTFKIINVVGTNGKGSTSKYINDSLIHQGYKVGKFTSPHLFKFNERITINNKEITNEQFFNIVNPYLEIYHNESIMWFAITYITAMMHFQKQGVDFVVLEAGIGGIKDPTSIIDGDWGVVTSIGEDHMELFHTRENISYDKAGISNKGMVFFIPSTLKKTDKDIFEEVLNKNKSTIIEVDNKSDDYKIRNRKMANAVIKKITNKDIVLYEEPFGRTTIRKINNSIVIYDVGHNLSGIKAVLKKLENENIVFKQVVLSLSKNKDDSEFFNLFKVPIFIYEHKGKSPKLIKDYKIKGTIICDINDFHKKIERNTLFIGSFFLINDLFKNDKK